MKIGKMVAAVGLTLALGAGLAACGAGYTGEGVVKDKEVVSQRKSSIKKYKVTIDVPNTDVNQVITLPKTQYDSVQVGQNVKIEDGNIKQ
jgi:ABC-type glycerol-3-phosphate transport system substrate-binding protein